MRRAQFLLLFPLSACQEETLDPDSFNWEVTVTGIEDLCNPTDPQPFQETVTYSLFFDGSITDIKVGPDSFASGIMTGCSLEYDTPVVGERRGPNEEYWVKWQLSGEALLRQGGSSCDITEGLDWEGTETFEIIETDDPDLAVGCTYTLSVAGTYLGQGA
jgi:hypothetical protein